MVAVLGDEGRGVDVGHEAGVFEGGGEVLDPDEVAVDDEEGHDVVGVVLEPFADCVQAGFVGAGVEEVAVGVAVVEGAVDAVDFARY